MPRKGSIQAIRTATGRVLFKLSNNGMGTLLLGSGVLLAGTGVLLWGMGSLLREVNIWYWATPSRLTLVYQPTTYSGKTVQRRYHSSRHISPDTEETIQL